jgi:hypothetical protein
MGSRTWTELFQRVTPAIEAGLTGHLWTVEEIAGLVRLGEGEPIDASNGGTLLPRRRRCN